MKTTEKIIEMLEQQEQQLWESLKTSRLVFGVDTEASHRAVARWNTTNEILQSIKTICNEKTT